MGLGFRVFGFRAPYVRGILGLGLKGSWVQPSAMVKVGSPVSPVVPKPYTLNRPKPENLNPEP